LKHCLSIKQEVGGRSAVFNHWYGKARVTSHRANEEGRPTGRPLAVLGSGTARRAAELELFQKAGYLLEGEDRPVLADILVAHVAAGALAQTALHLAFQRGDDLLVGKA